ncbi:MAG: DUF4186 domain-containing protein [Oscillospiraceae bacterium]|nr:DUF4186 domain-containing protein [Oscillospiraceae bacterium]
MPTVEETLMRLDRSKFRSSFYLTKKERAYYEEKGEDKIRSHTADFIRAKLAPAEPLNDGKQTPMHGHPAFKAMHACACCCRGCLEKWYHIPRGRELTENEQERIVKLLSAWIDREMKKER